MPFMLSYFDNALSTQPSTSIDLVELVQAIRAGQWQQPIEALQKATGNERIDRKRMLPAVTFSGLFSLRRKDACTTPSGLLVLDFDDVPDIPFFQVATAANPHAVAGFVSPSGTGYKVIYAIANPTIDATLFGHAYDAAAHHASGYYYYGPDRSGRDISRLSFVSCDPEAMYALEAEPLQWSIPTEDALSRATEPPQAGPLAHSGTIPYQVLYEQASRIMGRANEFGSRHGQVGKMGYLFGGYIAGGVADELDCVDAGEAIIDEAYSAEPERRKDERRNLRDAIRAGAKKPIFTVPAHVKAATNDIAYLGDVAKALTQRVLFRRNTVTTDLEFRYHNDAPEQWRRVEDRLIHNLLADLRADGIKTSKDRLWELIDTDMIAPDYMPFADYFNALRFTGADHERQAYYDDLIEALPLDDPLGLGIGLVRDHARRVLAAWMASAYAAITRGTANQIMPILQGAQGIGKSTFIRWLCPPQLQAYVYEGTIDTETDDAKRIMAQTFIYIDDELESLTRKDVGAIKRVITQPTMTYRKPYARMHITRPRTCSFIGSVNKQNFLTDETGNRRFPTIGLKGNLRDGSYQAIDIHRLWAVAKHSVETGQHWWLDSGDHKTTHAINEAYTVATMTDELVIEYMTNANEFNGVTMTTTQVAYRIAAEHSRANPLAKSLQVDQRFIHMLGSSLHKAGYEKRSARDAATKRPFYGWYVAFKM